MGIKAFVVSCVRAVLRGNRMYWWWLGSLAIVVLLGIWAYGQQAESGLVVTGMSDQVSWGIYIANFTFLVGMAAAAVMLVVPAYVFHNKAAHSVVLLAEGVAVASCIMCVLFVVVDLGQPLKGWHMIPVLGRLHFPESILAWDVIVLNGYLFLNLTIPAYVLFCHFRGKTANPKVYYPGVFISIFWAISIHTVT
ncbi:MAG: polysulfide reductase NrfD, partial [Acidobacteria bacterium]|nr:polysulfide reductase NrfD [Acidobacteriota bacterium]